MLNSPYILVLFASRNGSTKSLAESISRGIRQCPGMDVCFRTVPSIEQIKKGQDKCAETGAAFVTVEEFAGASALALGSPTQFGNMSSSLQYFLEQTTSLWFKGALVDKPVAVFTSTASLHGGQETTLINMLTPLLHHGMIPVGIPYTHKSLEKTKTGGSPYGATHVSVNGKVSLDEEEHSLAMAQGKRLATIAKALLDISYT